VNASLFAHPLFAHPEWQVGLLATLALAFGAVAAARLVASRRARRLLGPRGAGLGRLRASDAALLLAAAAIALALLGPRLGERTLWVRSSGVDVVVLVDVSPSMEARDTPPSRLTRAREAARHVLSELAPGDRVALAAFSGRGVLLTPLTPDTRAIRRMLPSLTPDLIQESGSQIGDGVRAALAAFEPASDRPRSLFVVSDGEDPARGDLGVDEAVRLGVRVVAAVFGREDGATIPQRGGLLHDVGGRVVVSRRELEPLSRLVAATDGRLLAANRWGEIDVSVALETLGRERGSTPGELVARRVPATRVAPIAALAFALLALELARGGRRGRLTRPALAGALAAVLGVGTLGSAELRELEGEVRARPRDAGALIALGMARAEADDAEEATRAFFAAAAGADDPELAALAYYDLGVAELVLGRWAAASQAFYDALALRPDDLEAKFNLEWALRALRDASPPPDPEPSAMPPPPSPPESADRMQEPEEENDPRPGEASPPREGESERVTQDLDPEAVERWLEQVPDEPARALRDTARSGHRPRQAPRAPGW
jgi:Ca-activated chloride channel family protein